MALTGTVINDTQGVGWGYSESGSGFLRFNASGFGTDFSYKTTVSGDKFIFTFRGVANGTHAAYATWVEAANRRSDVPCYADGSLLTTINQVNAPTADITLNGRPFKSLGNVVVSGNQTIIDFRHSATGTYTIADAILLVPPATALPDLSILWYGDSNLYSSGTGNDSVNGISTLLLGYYDLKMACTARSTQRILSGAELAVGGTQYNQGDDYSGIDLIVFSCGPADIINDPVKATFKTALRAAVDGLGAATGARVLLVQVGDFDYRYSGNSLPEATFLAARTRVRDAISEVAAESSYTVPTVVDTTGIAQGAGYDYVHYWSSSTMLASYQTIVANAIIAWATPAASQYYRGDPRPVATTTGSEPTGSDEYRGDSRPVPSQITPGTPPVETDANDYRGDPRPKT